MLEWFYDRGQERNPQDKQIADKAVNAACTEGHLAVVKFNVDRGVFPTALAAAGVNGHAHVISYLRERFGGQTHCENSASYDKMSSFVKEPTYSLNDLWRATHKNNLVLVKEILPRFEMQINAHQALFEAIQRGKLPLVKYSFGRELPCKNYGFAIQLAFDRYFYPQQRAMIRYQSPFDMDCTVHDPMDDTLRSLFDVCYYMGQHDKLQLDPDDQDDFGCVINAASAKRLKLIRLLHEKQVKGFSVKTMDYAAAAGALSMVRFLDEHRSEGCTGMAITMAATRGFLVVVEILRARRPDQRVDQALTNAAQNGHVQVVRFFLDHWPDDRQLPNTSRQEALHLAVGALHLNVVKHFLPHSSAVVDRSNQNGQSKLVQWTLNLACTRRCVEVVEFIVASGCPCDYEAGRDLLRSYPYRVRLAAELRIDKLLTQKINEQQPRKRQRVL